VEKINKPIVVHSRKAELDAVELLESSKIKNIVLHCFNGRRHLIKRAIEHGWYLSIPPIITRLQHFQMIAELAPIDQILTETDCPYLSPVPGKRNEPANVSVTVKEIARIKNLSEKKVADEIYENYKRVFT
jgi:TatD DNase family protein